MKGKSLPVDSVCFSAISRACGETGHLETTRELLYAIKDLTFQVDDMQCGQLIKALCAADKPEEAFAVLNLMVSRKIPIVSAHGYAALLKHCARRVRLSLGRKVHEHALQYCRASLCNDLVLLAAVITMYSRCGALGDAESVFEQAVQRGIKPSVMMWTALIQGMGLHGKATEALALLKRMQELARPPIRHHIRRSLVRLQPRRKAGRRPRLAAIHARRLSYQSNCATLHVRRGCAWSC